MKTNTKVALTTVGIGLLVALVSFMVQMPANWNESSFAFHYPLATNGLMAILHTGAALLFFMSLSVYKAKLRQAFTRIAIGILLIGLGTVQLPILDAFDLWETAYVTTGIIALPFLISGLTRLVGETNIVTNRKLVIGSAIALSAISTLLPHASNTVTELDFDITNALFVWIFVLDLAAALIFLRVRNRIGEHYKVAVTWLGIALLCSVTSVVIALLDAYTATTVRTSLTLALNTMVVIAGFAWLKAGYTFTKTKEY
jgi:hypothetical protein